MVSGERKIHGHSLILMCVTAWRFQAGQINTTAGENNQVKVLN